MKVLVACEYSGTVRDAFLAQGHIAVSCDILPCESELKNLDHLPYGGHYQGDVFDIVGDGWDMMIAHPPCTHLSVSGQWCYSKGFKPLYKKFEALAFVDRLLRVDIPMICLENPVSIISGQIRKSDQMINPFQFGHTEQKRTCLWLKNLPLLKATNDVYDEMMLLPRKVRERILWLGSNKGKERSMFYSGIASAMVDQWGGLL